MKLIIDIPEMAYDAYKEWHKNKVATVEQSLIANGIPYEEKPQGDLISREALKKHIAETFEIEEKIDKKWATGLKYSLKIIDNAPAVELTEDQAIDKLHETEWLIRHDKEMTERPQGKWMYNDYGNGCGNWHCSKCDHMPYYATKYMRFLNFCPNCGADMRGEQE